jgi:RNA polymerase sigma-70 factor (ECF subfamily)
MLAAFMAVERTLMDPLHAGDAGSSAGKAGPLRVVQGELSDHALVERALRNEPLAFEVLMRRYNRRLFRVARGILGDDGAAEDAVQETYLQVFTHLARYRPTGKFSAWLTRVTVNEALMLRRKVRADDISFDHADESVLQELRESFPARASASDDVEALQARQLLEHAIDRLQEPFRVVFILRMVEQLSVSETAAALAINEATVRTRLHRAQRMLRADLTDVLSREQIDVFQFAGARCDRIVTGVLARLGHLPAEDLQP